MKKNKLVSYCLFTYNQEKYIKSAVDAALSQTYSPLEIIISDDCSSDTTFEIIEEIVKNYSGPHKIILNKNEINLGLGGHFSKVCYTIAKGDYLIISAGDDISKINHVEKAVINIEKFHEVKMIDFSAEIIDENGSFVKKIQLDFDYKKNTLLDYLNLKKIELFAPGRIIDKELFHSFEPIYGKCPTEDSVMVLRSLLMGGSIRVNEQLVYYRKHQNNMSNINGLAKLSNLNIIAQYFKDILYLFDKDVIDENLCELLLKRVNLESKLRFFKFSKRNYKIQNITRPILTRLYIFYYKIKINSRIN